MVIPLEGNWDKGFAFDLHTESSIHIGTDPFGHEQFETRRTQMGELLYQLKYRQRREVAKEIVDLLAERFKTLNTFDAIIPCPATKSRPWQPVEEITMELGKRFGVAVINALVKDTSSTQIKDIEDPAEREKLLLESIRIKDTHDFSGKKVLLVDDLYQSGSTLSVATYVLKEQANAAMVCVLTMTKTRR